MPNGQSTDSSRTVRGQSGESTDCPRTKEPVRQLSVRCEPRADWSDDGQSTDSSRTVRGQSVRSEPAIVTSHISKLLSDHFFESFSNRARIKLESKSNRNRGIGLRAEVQLSIKFNRQVHRNRNIKDLKYFELKLKKKQIWHKSLRHQGQLTCQILVKNRPAIVSRQSSDK